MKGKFTPKLESKVHACAHTHTYKNYKFLKKGGQYLTGELHFNKNDESQKTMKVIYIAEWKKKNQLATLFFYQKSRQNKGIFDKTGNFQPAEPYKNKYKRKFLRPAENNHIKTWKYSKKEH